MADQGHLLERLTLLQLSVQAAEDSQFREHSHSFGHPAAAELQEDDFQPPLLGGEGLRAVVLFE